MEGLDKIAGDRKRHSRSEVLPDPGNVRQDRADMIRDIKIETREQIQVTRRPLRARFFNQEET
jgi:hypothetical protein